MSYYTQPPVSQQIQQQQPATSAYYGVQQQPPANPSSYGQAAVQAAVQASAYGAVLPMQPQQQQQQQYYQQPQQPAQHIGGYQAANYLAQSQWSHVPAAAATGYAYGAQAAPTAYAAPAQAPQPGQYGTQYPAYQQPMQQQQQPQYPVATPTPSPYGSPAVVGGYQQSPAPYYPQNGGTYNTPSRVGGPTQPPTAVPRPYQAPTGAASGAAAYGSTSSGYRGGAAGSRGGRGGSVTPRRDDRGMAPVSMPLPRGGPIAYPAGGGGRGDYGGGYRGDRDGYRGSDRGYEGGGGYSDRGGRGGYRGTGRGGYVDRPYDDRGYRGGAVAPRRGGYNDRGGYSSYGGERRDYWPGSHGGGRGGPRVGGYDSGRGYDNRGGYEKRPYGDRGDYAGANKVRNYDVRTSGGMHRQCVLFKIAASIYMSRTKNFLTCYPFRCVFHSGGEQTIAINVTVMMMMSSMATRPKGRIVELRRLSMGWRRITRNRSRKTRGRISCLMRRP
ncbi:hypothetical protein DFJ77DRAFT_203445 [Powellomyces hirtus]|nr:hypothetical protein DFJ77DRAFT_203445 [Powellomyces hirtus]